jgi:exosortase K
MKARACAIVGAVLIAWALKQHYAGARADDLWWILAPTAKLASLITGVPLTLLAGEGYFSRERLFLIEKSCAGVNFMIAAFAMLVAALFHRISGGLSAVRVLGVSLVASYVAAVGTNALRIAIAMWLAAHPAALTSLGAADIHRLEGIVVYFGGLVLLHDLAQRLDRRGVRWSSGADGRRVEATS